MARERLVTLRRIDAARAPCASRACGPLERGGRALIDRERTREREGERGREPCVLLQYEDGSISMFLDYEELKAAGGRVNSFEKLVESRLNIYL